MTQLQESGAAPATSTRAVLVTRPLCCPTVTSWLQEDTIVSLLHFLILPIESSSMTRLPEPGVAPGILISAVVVTPLPCYPTVKSWSQGASLTMAYYWTTPNFMTWPPGCGASPTIFGQLDPCTWRHCCRAAKSWLLLATSIASLTFSAVRNSMTLLLGPGAAPVI